MSRFNFIVTVIVIILVTLAINVAFGNYLAARIATLPVMRKLNLFDPRAPIVVTNRETVRVSDANDAVEAANTSKSRLATVVYADGDHLVTTGGALNWTADGYFVATQSAFATAGKSYSIVMNDGRVFPIQQVVSDTATRLVMLKTAGTNITPVTLAQDNQLRAGQKILFLVNSTTPFKTQFLESYVNREFDDVAGLMFDADRPSRGVRVQSVTQLVPGHALVALNGDVVGLWDPDTVISGAIIRTFASNFFADNQTVRRPLFGFTYGMISGVESTAVQSLRGARIVSVIAGSPAAAAGLQVGDTITALNGDALEDPALLEEALDRIRPGIQVQLSIMRGTTPVTVSFTAGLLK